MKRIAVIFCICCLLGGCKKQESPYRVVTAVEVRYQQGENILYRSYTRDENITAVLNYLRLLKPDGPVTPEETEERAKLRRIYIDSVVGNLKGQLENTTIVYPDGSKKKVTHK